MEQQSEHHLEQILTQIRHHFTDVEIKERDVSTSRAVLQVIAKHGEKRIAVTEILTLRGRRYSYYLLRGDVVLLGLDNFRDRPAQRLKYGKDFAKHLHEYVPHLHTENKQKLELTEEKTLDDFVQMVLQYTEKKP